MNKIWKGRARCVVFATRHMPARRTYAFQQQPARKERRKYICRPSWLKRWLKRHLHVAPDVPSHLLAVLALSAYPPRQPRPQRCPSHRSGPPRYPVRLLRPVLSILGAVGAEWLGGPLLDRVQQNMA